MAQATLEVLAPLRDALHDGGFIRILARPGWVLGERPGGTLAVDAKWTENVHTKARTLVSQAEGEALSLDPTTSVTLLGETIVVWRAIDALWRTDNMAREGWLSSLAARTLSAAVATGRNVLVTGPWPLCAHVVAALINEGQRPALVGCTGATLPLHWAKLPDVTAALAYGADRVGAWSLPAPMLVAAMGQLSGVVGTLDGGRLDRVLMRFEAGAEQLPGRTPAPLSVLASLDLVVVTTHQGGPRIREIAEIVLTESGYRPSHLFRSGLAPAPTALMPVSAPSFVEDLAMSGHAGLADELRHVAAPPQVHAGAAHSGAMHPAVAHPAVTAAQQPPAQVPSVVAQRSAPPPHRPHEAHVARIPLPKAVESELSDPGWELDRIKDESNITDAAPGQPHVDDAAMAATFGLGPPPRPQGSKVFGDFMREAGELRRDESGDVMPPDDIPEEPEID